MAPLSAVNIVEVCRVAPLGPPESAIPMFLPLTFFDAIWLNLSPTQRLLFYETPAPHLFLETILPKLKHSLSLTLRHLLPLAGTVVWPPDSDSPFIRVKQPGNGAAVSLTVAESDAEFDHFAVRDFQGSRESHNLIPDLPMAETEAEIIALQVTSFRNGGFCIGITANHCVVDGKTSAMFLKLWASFCKLKEGSASPPPALVPFYDRTVIDDPKGIRARLIGAKRRSLACEMPPTEGAVRGRFVVSRQQVEKLREKCASSLGQKHKHLAGTRISTFALACAHVWACLTKAQKVQNKTVYFGFAADSRSRLVPPIPETYFGNCLGGGVAKMETSALIAEDGAAAAAAEIAEAIRKMKEKGVSKEPEDWVFDAHFFSTEKLTSVAGSPQLGLYGVDFGWGRPWRVEVVSIDRTGAIGLAEGRDESGGIEVAVVLDKPSIDIFASLFGAT